MYCAFEGLFQGLKICAFFKPKTNFNEFTKFNFVFHPNFIIQNVLQLLVKMLLDGMASNNCFKLRKFYAILQNIFF
jgi:hypothetical protein